jgi:hypothetical protein
MRTHGGVVAPGFLSLREPGFRVFTRSQLRSELKLHAKGKGVAAWESQAGSDEEELIYALFRTRLDPVSREHTWRGNVLMDQIEIFESDIRNKPIGTIGRESPYPRILSLRDVLKART